MMAVFSITAHSTTHAKVDIASGAAVPLTEASPQLVVESGGHKALILELIFTADGRELLSVSHDKTIRVWSVTADGKGAALSRTIRGQMGDGRAGSLWSAALSPADAQQRHHWLAVGGFLAGSPKHRYAIRLHDYGSATLRNPNCIS
jgi:WD40 repeat protein